MNNKPFTAHVVAHTHWDREWYNTFQVFRMRLVRLIDRLLGLLEEQPGFHAFTLDGQVIPLLDYLEIRPENEARLRALVAGRQLLVGPWYLLPDEFLVSGEALVRNLLIGRRIASDFGRCMNLGYIPDTFGHIAQLPQILRGFGLETTCWWRGLSGDEYQSELWWEAPDGSRVLLHKLPEYSGYSSACALYPDAEAAVQELEAIVRTEAQRAATRHILVMAGTDHLEPRADLPRLIELANQRSTIAEYILSDIEQYSQAVLNEIDAGKLATTCGEQRDTSRAEIGGGFILPNVLSARIHLKQQNAAAQTALERWAEPFSALLALYGRPYPHALLERAWQWLLQNHTHDCICGTSVDPVHEQMVTRFQWAQEVADTLAEEAFDWLAVRMNVSGVEEGEVGLLVFNGLGWGRRGTVTIDVDLPLSVLSPLPEPGSVEESYSEHHSRIFTRHSAYLWNPFTAQAGAFRGLRLRDVESGEILPVQIEAAGDGYVTRNLRHGPLALERAYRLRVSFIPPDLPALGWRLFAVRPEPLPNKYEIQSRPANVLENEFLRAEIQPNGTLRLLHKETGRIYNDLAFFEDGGEAGDSYSYSYPAFDQVINTLGAAPRISRLSDGPAIQRCIIDYTLDLPVGLTDDRRARRADTTPCHLRVMVSLGAGWHRLELEVTFENRACDHRLRIVFPAGIRVENSYSDTPFDVTPHPTRPRPVPPQRWIEDPPRQFPQTTFVDVSDGKHGLAVLSTGTPEYEVGDDERGEVKITLLRAFGYLGGEDELQTIRGGGGPHMSTPLGQVPGRHVFRLAVLPHSGDWADAEVLREAHEHAVPPKPRTLGGVETRQARLNGHLPPCRSMLRISGKNIVLSAVKRCYMPGSDDRTLVVRVYNPDVRPNLGRLVFDSSPTRVELARLDETPCNTLPLEPDGSLSIVVPAKKIVTLLVHFGNP